MTMPSSETGGFRPISLPGDGIEDNSEIILRAWHNTFGYHATNCAIKPFNQPVTLQIISCNFPLFDVNDIAYLMKEILFKIYSQINVNYLRLTESIRDAIQKYLSICSCLEVMYWKSLPPFCEVTKDN
ncbi:hypothetical protein RF11_15692 [Thelohanellus kitauei]|uniref:Uncharacterized protein n=1 Tax=Thelohanellus kitauei TaxID=669202 RepID=A0A0C2MRQ6_THEKT|nr:hypothetical protein RF11_15692 [Thelohanellus kitauei]